MEKHHDAYRYFASGEDNRRSSSRYATKDTPASIEWAGEGVGRAVTSTTLKDLSVGGALVETESGAVPPVGTLVLFRLVDVPDVGAIEAKVVGADPPRPPGRSWFRRKAGRAAWRVRLEFTSPCPYEFFKAAIDVDLAGDKDLKTESNGFDSRDWR